MSVTGFLIAPRPYSRPAAAASSCQGDRKRCFLLDPIEQITTTTINSIQEFLITIIMQENQFLLRRQRRCLIPARLSQKEKKHLSIVSSFPSR